MNKESKKVGILTFHFPHNCGAALQAYALERVVAEYGECEIINYRPDYHAQWYDYRYQCEYLPNILKSIWKSDRNKVKAFARILYSTIFTKKSENFNNAKHRTKVYNSFEKKYLRCSPVCKNKDQVEALFQKYNIVIVGSDQVWNPQVTGENLDEVYFLPFASKNEKRYSYAASAGGQLNEEYLDILAEKLKCFNGVSVREGYLKNDLQIRKIDCRVDVDPTLLLNKEDYLPLEKSVKQVHGVKYVFIYAFHISDELIEVLKLLKARDNYSFFSIPMNGELKIKAGFDITEVDIVGPSEFLYLIHNADFIVASTFHGIIFPAIYEKQFVCLDAEGANARLINFLKMFGLENHKYSKEGSLVFNEEYTQFREMRNSYAKGSKQYLMSIINRGNTDV